MYDHNIKTAESSNTVIDKWNMLLFLVNLVVDRQLDVPFAKKMQPDNQE